MDALGLGQVAAAEALGVLFAVAYLVLAVRQNILCWPAALISSVLSVVVMFEARLYSESALQVFYAAMAIYGWYQWRSGHVLIGNSRSARLAPPALRHWYQP